MTQQDPSHDSGQQNTRRRLLKTTLVGGGAAATLKTLPDQWLEPTVDSVLLPAHATTTPGEEEEPVTGVFTATDVGIVARNHQPGSTPSRGIQYALLDAVIPRANASHIVGGICNNVDDDEGPAPAEIVIRINEDRTVDVAVRSEETDGTCGAQTTINEDNTIDDVSVQLDEDEFLDLTNMTASAVEVLGDWATDTDGDTGDDGDLCSGQFTALIGGTFPGTIQCKKAP